MDKNNLYERNLRVPHINVISFGQKNYTRTNLITWGINVVSSGQKKFIRDKFESMTHKPSEFWTKIFLYKTNWLIDVVVVWYSNKQCA